MLAIKKLRGMNGINENKSKILVSLKLFCCDAGYGELGYLAWVQGRHRLFERKGNKPGWTLECS